MSKTPNTKMIGLFTIAGILVFAGFMFVFLGNKLFVRNKDLVVMYFDESVKGLNIGSPVVLRGVEVGRINKIEMVADTDDMSFKIPVFMKADTHQIVEANHRKSTLTKRRLITKLVQNGMRARLVTQNILTGQLMVELVMLPDTKIVYKGDGSHKEIPTVISPMGELSKGLQDFPVRDSLEKFNILMDETTKLVDGLNKTLNTAGGDFDKTIRDFGDAARSIRDFSDYIERHPEALLKGKRSY